MRPRLTDPLLMTPELVQRGEQRPSLRHAAVGWREAQHAAATSVLGLESEKCLDGLGAGARHVARGCPAGINREAARANAAKRLFQRREEDIAALKESLR